MKKNVSVLIILLYSLVIYSQPFLEDFDGVTPPALPAGWSSFSLFSANGHPCTVSDDWGTIDEGTFAGCLPDPVTTSTSTPPNFAFIGDVAGMPPGDMVEDVLLTPVLMGLLSDESYDIKFSLRRTDLSPMPTTATVFVKLQYLPDVDGDGFAEPGGDDGMLFDITTISLVDGADEPWAGFMESWSPPTDDDYFIGWQALWTEIGETGVCLDNVEISGAPPLPVELSSFTANFSNGSIKLNWVTQTEIDNLGFEVERQVGSRQSTVGNWKLIGFVDGHGNSNSPKEYSFLDEGISYGVYSYRLKQIDNDGTFEYSNEIQIEAGEIPDEIVLEQNYPNPFNPSTTIWFAINESVQAILRVYNVLGNEITELFNERTEAGKVYHLEFDAENLSSGIYFYSLETPSRTIHRKMILIK